MAYARPYKDMQINFLAGEQYVPRIWMITEDNSQLIQVQRDRFARNWRRYHDHNLSIQPSIKFARTF